MDNASGKGRHREAVSNWLAQLKSAFEVTDLLRALDKAKLLFQLDCAGIFGDTVIRGDRSLTVTVTVTICCELFNYRL